MLAPCWQPSLWQSHKRNTALASGNQLVWLSHPWDCDLALRLQDYLIGMNPSGLWSI